MASANNRLSHLSLFTGIGGFDLACDWLGIKTVMQAESDPRRLEDLRRLWPDTPKTNDVRNIYRFANEFDKCPDCGEPFCARHGKHFSDCDCLGCCQWDYEYGQIDIITAGVPCQPSSQIGLRKGKNDARWLWPETLRIVSRLKPTICLFENPVGFRTLDNGKHFREVLGTLARLGYGVWWDTLRASDVGAAHQRARVFILAYSDLSRLERHAGDGEGVWFAFKDRPIAPLALRDIPDSGAVQGKSTLSIAADGIPVFVAGEQIKGNAYQSVIEAIGNAVVPSVSYEIIRAFLEAVRDKTKN